MEVPSWGDAAPLRPSWNNQVRVAVQVVARSLFSNPFGSRVPRRVQGRAGGNQLLRVDVPDELVLRSP
jgi:hypothetical protein